MCNRMRFNNIIFFSIPDPLGHQRYSKALHSGQSCALWNSINVLNLIYE